MALEGCVLASTSIVLPTSVDYLVPWDTETQFGSLSFFDVGVNDTLIVPDASLVGEKIQLFGAIYGTGGGGGTDGRLSIEEVGGPTLAYLQWDNDAYCSEAIRTYPYTIASGDQFRLRYRSFGTTANANDAYCRFGCLINPQDHLLGVVHARQSSDQSVASLSTLNWGTIDLDTLSTHGGGTSNTFTAPANAKACVVSTFGQTNPGSTSDPDWRVLKNGSLDSIVKHDAQFRTGAGAHFLIPVTSGDTIQIQLDHTNSTVGSQTHVMIEWYGD